MKPRLKNIITYLFIIFAFINCENNVNSSDKDDITEVLQSVIDAKIGDSVPGIQVSVSTDEFGTISVASGVANIENGEIMTVDHSLRIASATKLFTATLILKLIENNNISLDDTLSHLLPDISFSGADYITVKNLLQHTTGLLGYFNDDVSFQQYVLENPKETYTPKYLIDRALMLYSPGKEDVGVNFYYCNTNYVILGLIIEKYYNTTYTESIENEISDVFNLTETKVANDLENVNEMSEGYIYLSDDPILSNPYNHSFLFAAGNIVSKTTDLVRFIDLLMKEKIITGTTLEMMKSYFVDEDGNQYGLGLANFEGLGIGHNGLTLGYNSIIIYNSDYDISISVLINCLSVEASAEAVARSVLDAVIDFEN